MEAPHNAMFSQWMMQVSSQLQQLVTKMSILNSIDSSVKELSGKVKSLNDEVGNLKARVGGVEHSQQFISASFDEVKLENSCGAIERLK